MEMAIRSFGDRTTEQFFFTGHMKKGVGWASVRNIARRKLDMLHYAALVTDLRSPPGNRFERLSGKLGEYFSIRINDQWRIIFQWSAAGPAAVKIVDYH